MVELVPPSESATHRVVESVLETLLADNTPEPSQVFIDDGDGSWRRFAAMQPVEARRRSVLVTASDESLGDALLFEIGGASRMPISTPSMEAACESAAEDEGGPVVPFATQGVLEALTADVSEILLVGWRPPAFWLRQIGPVRSMTRLAEVAERLEILPVILPGPVLVVTGRTATEVEAVWRHDEGVPGSPPFPDPPWIVKLATSDIPTGAGVRIEDFAKAWIAEPGKDDERPGADFSVLEIPSGRKVGCWSLAGGPMADEAQWRATPGAPQHTGCSWDLARQDGSSEVVRESISLAFDEVAEQSLIRVPGSVGAQLRQGSPAGLLIEGMARHPARHGRPIWVPSVDAAGVRFLLGVAGPVWVDGPGVPG